ncbi:quinon protein alcohol dehydrogenase-like superfamily [Suillus fuscotomentosus]|uniref:Quinon protein alcohol dehydrogenase-like superfamily n=1 Tax=Suillus fuscotomentosus TaxID=1912939 RepID=A0AAD4HHA3_9AGAM|nr:quinon protein alcohol dehydrogenase-like superfamily [Suillus fuscotomentosus]KAG1896457.1 quinon protein alcohol dehydrogenase-like superfamily [Suillus fuscotomentosus]
MSLKGHERGVSCMSYFPDGKQIISGSGDKTARRWDLQKSKEIVEARDVCEEGVYAVTVSKDGRYVTTGGGEMDTRELKACEVETGIVKAFRGHSERVACVDISADSTLLVSGSWDTTAQIWSLDTDSEKLAVKSEVGTCLEVWDVHTETLDIRAGKSGGNLNMAFAPVFWTNNLKKRTIVTACNFANDEEATMINEFDALTMEIVGAPFEGHTKCITSLAPSSGGTLLASASQDHSIKLWAFDSRQLLASFHVQDVKLLVPSPDSRHLAYTITGRDICICNTPPAVLTALEAQSTLQKSNKTLEHLLQSDARRPAAVRRNPGTLPAISFTPRRQRPPATTNQQQPIYLRLSKLFHFSSRQTNQPRDPLDFPATLPLPSNLSLSQQSATQVENFEISSPPYSSNGVAQFLRQHLPFLIPRHSHGPPVIDVATGRKVTRLAAAKLPEYRKVDDTRHPPSQQPRVTQDIESSDIDSLPDVHWFKVFLCYYSCFSHGRLRMPPQWHLERVDIPHQDGVAGSGHSGIRFAVTTSSSEGHTGGTLVWFHSNVQLWDAAMMLPLGEPFRGHTGLVLSVSFSPDGTRIMSGSQDSTVRLWDAATGLPLGEPFRGHTRLVLSVSFSPDGTRIVSASEDSTVRLWDAATEQQFQEHIEIHSSAFSLDRRPTTPCICFASSLEYYALQDPAELLEGTSHLDSNPVMLNDGWMKAAHHRLFFWVPLASRERPFYSPRIAFTIPRGQEIDLSHMAHGENWSNCRDV